MMGQTVDQIIDEAYRTVVERIPEGTWHNGYPVGQVCGDLLSYAGQTLKEIMERCPDLKQGIMEAIRDELDTHMADIIQAARAEAGRGRQWVEEFTPAQNTAALDGLRDALLVAAQPACEATGDCITEVACNDAHS